MVARSIHATTLSSVINGTFEINQEKDEGRETLFDLEYVFRESKKPTNPYAFLVGGISDVCSCFDSQCGLVYVLLPSSHSETKISEADGNGRLGDQMIKHLFLISEANKVFHRGTMTFALNSSAPRFEFLIFRSTVMYNCILITIINQ